MSRGIRVAITVVALSLPGAAAAQSGVGVYGAGSGVGVYGAGSGVGVYGAGSGVGVYGAGSGVGVYGAGSGVGVYGAGSGVGVYGAGSGVGVYGGVVPEPGERVVLLHEGREILVDPSQSIVVFLPLDGTVLDEEERAEIAEELEDELP